MYNSIDAFVQDWTDERNGTLRLLEHLTDAALAQPICAEGRTLGRIAWHLVLTLGEMMAKTGLSIDVPDEDAPMPERAAQILDAYRIGAESVLQQVQAQWTDAMLDDDIPMYGETWKRGFVLQILITHEIHHRGQMTVLMRQAGLRIPGLCGPTREDWMAFGMPVLE